MKRMIVAVIFLMFSVCLSALTDKERIELTRLPVEDTHVLVILKVPVLIDGTTRPDIPRTLRELRSIDVIIYDDDANPEKSDWCLVFMIIPQENESEFITRNNAFSVSETELITPAKEALTGVTFPDFQDIKAAMLERITNADAYKSATP
jgi:hypothetical protein